MADDNDKVLRPGACRRFPWATGVLLAVLVSGCLSPASRPQLEKSKFYSQCKDWAAVINKSVPNKEVVVENMIPMGGVEGGRTGRMHYQWSLGCDVRCSPENIDKFMQSLRTEVRKMVQQAGGEIDEEGDSGAVEGHLGAFEFEYTVGPAHGQVSAKLAGGKATSDKSDVKSDAKIYPLVTKIEEWVR